MVAIAFILNPDNKPCIDHIDTDKTNNHVDNLHWVTYSENSLNPITNAKQRKRTGWLKDRFGEKHPNSNRVFQYTKDNIIVAEYGSVIIEEMRAFMRLDLNPRQKQYFADTIAVAKRVDIVRAADVFNDYELEIIRDILKPQPQQCYRNAHLLCQLFPERVRYCEGKTFAFIPIEHAFNRVGDKYVDITFEFALQYAELLEHEYVVFGEYDLRTLERITRETGYYGDIYRNIYIERVKDNPRRNEVTPGVGTQ